MKDTTQDSGRDAASVELAARYEALIRDLGILRQLEGLDPTCTLPEDICARLVGSIAREDGAEQCSVMFFNAHTGRLVLRAIGTRYAHQGYSLPLDAWQGKQFALDEGIAGKVAARRRHVRVDDTECNPDFLFIPDSPVNIRSLLCYPLIANDELLGVLNLSHSSPGYFSPDREQCGWLLAQRASALIAAAQANSISPSAAGAHRDASNHHEHPLYLHVERLHAIGEMARGMAAELGDHLNQIVGTLDRALLQNPLETSRDLISEARRSSIESAAIVERITTFARAATTPRCNGLVTLKEVFHEVRTMLRNQHEAGLDISVQVPHDLPAIQGDGARLHQLFLNLCMNALDALHQNNTTPHKKNWVRIGAEVVRIAHEQPGPWGEPGERAFLRAFVSDSGMGMSPEVAAQANNPFFTTKSGGTGLGLTTAFHIAQQHDGWTDIESEPGNGTTVNLYLPLPSDFVGNDFSGVTATAKKPENPMILLVDDEPLLRSLGAAMLKKLGYASVTAACGTSAVAAYEHASDDIILAVIDVNMTGMSGHETLACLRKINPALPVILSSGDFDHAISEPTAPHLSPSGFLLKPYLIATMAEVIEEALRKTPTF